MQDLRNIRKGWDRALYFATNFGLYFLPDCFSRLYFNTSKANLKDTELEEIDKRVNYYAKFQPCVLEQNERSFKVGDFCFPFGEKEKHSTYFFDIFPFIRHFPNKLTFNYIAGDIDYEPDVPTFVKARPIVEADSNSVLLRLNSIRHFRFITDNLPFDAKDNTIVFRNEVRKQPWRSLLLKKYIDHPMTDLGQINNDAGNPDWVKPFMSISEQLKHKFIMCIQGHDVATNLKWVMSSNSMAVMPKPSIESWFMEGKLKPDFHYIEVDNDYSNLIEKVEWFISRPSYCKEIVNNAHKWVDRFRDIRIERIIMERVIERYFKLTGQL